jgi:ABC-2 type transport system permease protein
VISDVLPLSFAVDAMQTVAASSASGEVWQDIAVVAAYVVAGLALGALTLRRQSD